MHNRGAEIVERSLAYLGLPWRHQGRSAIAGVDCVGLLILVARDLGITDFDTNAYSRRPDVQRFDGLMREAGCRRIAHAAMAHGDIVRVSEDGWPVHCAIYDATDRRWIIHATARLKAVVREPLDEVRDRQITSVWRFPE